MNQRASVDAVDKTGFCFTDHERQLILDKADLPPGVANRLRMGLVREGQTEIQLSSRQAQLLLSKVSDARARARGKRQKQELAALASKIVAIIEGRDPVVAPPGLGREARGNAEPTPGQDPELFEITLEKLPREVQDQIKAMLTQGGNLSIDDVNQQLAGFFSAHNHQPMAEMGGLSPEAVRRLMYDDWYDPNSVMRLNTELSKQDLADTQPVRDAWLILKAMLDKDGVKATAKGNLNREFVKEMLSQLLSPEEAEHFWQISKVANEFDLMPLHRARILLTLAGFMRLAKGMFHVTKRGKTLLRSGSDGELFAALIHAHFKKFNLAYFDMYPKLEGVQVTISYTLYRLSCLDNKWRGVEAIAEDVLLPAVRQELRNAHESGSWMRPLQCRVLQPLHEYGLLDAKRVEQPDETRWWDFAYEYRKSKLLTKLFRFDPELPKGAGRR